MSNNHFISNPAILNEARDYLDGLLLGDGHICTRNKKTGNYSHSCKYKEWLNNISSYFYECGIVSKVYNGVLRTGGFCSKDGSFIYNFESHKYVEFKEMHNMWYKVWYDLDSYPKRRWHKDDDGEYFIWKKIVPKDICLTPDCVANWYLGDGTIPKHKYRRTYRIFLSTNDFLREDTEFLSCLLSEVLDIRSIVNKRGLIEIGLKDDVYTFLNYMKNCEIPDCYSYKFPEEAMK